MTTIDVAPQTHVTVRPPDDEDHTWAITGDLRKPGTGWDCQANYDVSDTLRPRFPTIDFDPESSCFYAYATSAADATALVEAIKATLTEMGR